MISMIHDAYLGFVQVVNGETELDKKGKLDAKIQVKHTHHTNTTPHYITQPRLSCCVGEQSVLLCCVGQQSVGQSKSRHVGH